MYRVSTVHLSADATHADPQAGTIELGELSAGEVVLLLEHFRDLNMIENLEADPYIEIYGHSGKFHIRAGRRRLFLYNARDTVEPYAELTPAEIIIQLERDAVTVAPFVRPRIEPEDRPRMRPSFQRGIAVAILTVGLLVNSYTVYSVTYVEVVNQKPDLALLTEAGDIAARRTEVAGTYATGERTGDRVITLSPDGRVQFSEVGRTSRIAEVPETYQIGRSRGKLHLLTSAGDPIEILNLETLVCYRDTYRRRS